MKCAVLMHGNGGSDQDYFWFRDTKKYLEKHGYEVFWPPLPDTDAVPDLVKTVEYAKLHAPLSDGDIAIGHSSGCPAILYWLQTTDVHLKQVVLVSGLYGEGVRTNTISICCPKVTLIILKLAPRLRSLC